MSSKQGYLHTRIIEKMERDKMSAYRNNYSDEEEERMVARVGGRARGLVQAVKRIHRERERAGQTILNSQEAQNVQLRMSRQEVGLPCGWVEALVRRPGELQAWGRRSPTNSAPGTMTGQDSQQTRPNEPQWTRVRARARPSTPSNT